MSLRCCWVPSQPKLPNLIPLWNPTDPWLIAIFGTKLFSIQRSGLRDLEDILILDGLTVSARWRGHITCSPRTSPPDWKHVWNFRLRSSRCQWKLRVPCGSRRPRSGWHSRCHYGARRNQCNIKYIAQLALAFRFPCRNRDKGVPNLVLSWLG